MNSLLDSLLALQNTALPYLFIGVGFMFVFLAFSERVAWLVEWSPGQLLRLLPVGAVLAITGILWAVMPDPRVVSLLPQSTPQPTPLPPPFVAIDEPAGALSCATAGAVCRFEVRGQAGGVLDFGGYRVYTFVFPLDPSGPGYYLQERSAAIGPAGDWVQSPASIGSQAVPVAPGQRLEIRAALMQTDATYFGTRLPDLPANFYLSSIEDIEGVLAVSSPVRLTVE